MALLSSSVNVHQVRNVSIEAKQAESTKYIELKLDNISIMILPDYDVAYDEWLNDIRKSLVRFCICDYVAKEKTNE